VKLVAGLGNPGAKYRGTRHNVGFEVADVLAGRHGIDFQSSPADALVARVRGATPMLLVKPLSLMNRSGQPVAELARYFRIAIVDILIVVDDVNLPLGFLRARARGSAGGHNGLRSIATLLGTEAFARLRIGVGRGDPRRDLADHVLARFDPDEQAPIDDAIGQAADAAELFAAEGIDPVMNRYNRKAESPDSEEG
jgi:PTH1 family peptidyl-tRNA hydrolase